MWEEMVIPKAEATGIWEECIELELALCFMLPPLHTGNATRAQELKSIYHNKEINAARHNKSRHINKGDGTKH
jgi:hypothetical protein